MTVAIRPAEPADLPALIELWTEAWTAFLPEIDFVARRPWFIAYLAELQRAGAELLVAADAAPLGFVSVDAAKQDLDQLVTAPAAQRRGIARRLVHAAKHRSPQGLHLTVLQRNVPAIALYRAEGFTVTGEGVSPRSGLPTFHMGWTSDAPLPPALSEKGAAATENAGRFSSVGRATDL